MTIIMAILVGKVPNFAAFWFFARFRGVCPKRPNFADFSRISRPQNSVVPMYNTLLNFVGITKNINFEHAMSINGAIILWKKHNYNV